MQPEIRKKYNESFSPEKYKNFLADLDTATTKPVEFRVAETPVFVPKYLKNKLIGACKSIIDVIVKDDYKAKTDKADRKSVV